MEKQKYSRSSLIGRVYLWWARFANKPIKEDENFRSCDIRRAVFIEIPVFFVIASVAVGGTLLLGFLLLEWVGLTIIIKTLLAGGVTHIVIAWVDSFRETEDKSLHSFAILSGWWDDIYNKICKPVEWVD